MFLHVLSGLIIAVPYSVATYTLAAHYINAKKPIPYYLRMMLVIAVILFPAAKAKQKKHTA